MSLQTSSEWQARGIARILESLSRSDGRTGVQYAKLREYERQSLQAAMWVCTPSPEDPVMREDHPTTVQAWCYSVSRSGIGFIATTPLEASIIGVGLILPLTIKWKLARLVRCRKIPQEEFWEFGAAFDGI